MTSRCDMLRRRGKLITTLNHHINDACALLMGQHRITVNSTSGQGLHMDEASGVHYIEEKQRGEPEIYIDQHLSISTQPQ